MLKPARYSFDFDLTTSGPIYRVKQAVRQALWKDSECPIIFSERWAGDAAIVEFRQTPSFLAPTEVPYAGHVTFVDEGLHIRLYVSVEADLTQVNWLRQIQLRMELPGEFKKKIEKAVKTTESPSKGLN